MLETAWESRWVPDYLKKLTRESVLYRTDTFQWVEIKAKPVLKNVLTWFSRAVLFHITGFYQWLVDSSWSSLLMTDKLQSACTLKTTYWIYLDRFFWGSLIPRKSKSRHPRCYIVTDITEKNYKLVITVTYRDNKPKTRDSTLWILDE